MPRRDIAMSGADVDEFLSQCAHLVVGVIDVDGWPTGTIAASTYRDGALALVLPADDRVLDMIERDARICCVADEHATYYDIRGVIVHATGERTGASGVNADVDRVISFDFGRLR